MHLAIVYTNLGFDSVENYFFAEIVLKFVQLQFIEQQMNK